MYALGNRWFIGVLFLFGLWMDSFALKTIHVYSPWLTDPVRSAYDIKIQGTDGADFDSWWPGQSMTAEGNGWYSFSFTDTALIKDIQFRLMAASDNNGTNAEYLTQEGLSSDQGTSIADITAFGSMDDVYMVWNKATSSFSFTELPPPSLAKFVMILNPFRSALKVKKKGETQYKNSVIQEVPCGWYAFPVLKSTSLSIRLQTADESLIYGAGGLGSTDYMDLTAWLTLGDTVWITTNSIAPSIDTVWNGVTGDCGVIRLASIIRDFPSDGTHSDFETVGWNDPCGEVSKGMVDSILGSDKKPVRLRETCNNSNFDDWFGRTGDSSVYWTGCLELDLKINDQGIYEKRNDAFFPLDHVNKASYGDPFNQIGVIFGASGKAQTHNYGFCLETHAKFIYKGGEVFTFRGDDDVWAFIDNHLVVDIGGVHQQYTDSVKLDELGLIVGNSYQFDFFFCERQSTESHMWITTDIDLREDRDILYNKEVFPLTGKTGYYFELWLHTKAGVGCVTDNTTERLKPEYLFAKQGNAAQIPLAVGTYFGGGLEIRPSIDSVVIDTNMLVGLDSGATYVLYILDPYFHEIRDSVLIEVPKPWQPNRPPVVYADTFDILEDAPVGSLVGNIPTYDADGDALEIGLGPTELFRIDSDGNLWTADTLDYEASPRHFVTVWVTDGEDTTTVVCVVRVGDVRESIEVRIESVFARDILWAPDPDTIWINTMQAILNVKVSGLLFPIPLDTSVFVEVQEGFNREGYEQCTEELPIVCARDSVVILVNTLPPKVEWNPVIPDTSGLINFVFQYIPSDTFFINNPQDTIQGTLFFINKMLQPDSMNFGLELDSLHLQEGCHKIPWQWMDAYGNMVYDTLDVCLDMTPPKVEILDPKEKEILKFFSTDVVWMVDSLMMDTLNREALVKGPNVIIRMAVDRAGNVGADTVKVFLMVDNNNATIDLVKGKIILTPELVNEHINQWPIRDGESFNVSIINQTTQMEEEILWGNSNQKHYPDSISQRIYENSLDAHLGPVLRMDIRFPHVGGYDAEGIPREGTLADLLEWVKNNPQADTASVLCSQSIPSGNLRNIPLWRHSVHLAVDVFDNLGQFVNRIELTYDGITHEYLNDEGMATLYFSLSPDVQDHEIKDKKGRVLATGAYIMRGSVLGISTYLWCGGEYSYGDEIKNSATVLKFFGYRRLSSH